MSKEEVLSICEKLKQQKLISEIEEKKYSINILVRADDEFENESYSVRNRIKQNFEEKNYRVKILGSWWLEINFVDIEKIIDDCFE